MYRGMKILGLAATAVAATAACSSPSTSTAAPPVATPSASVGVGSAAEQGTGSVASPSPSKTTPKAAPTTKKPSTGQGGQSSEPDWKRVGFKALGCKHSSSVPDKADVLHVDRADLTGDGRREAILAASCPTTTATNEVFVFVLDPDNTSKPLLTIGKGVYLRTADVRTNGRTLTVVSEALSDDAPRCCPDIVITQSWKWNGSTFDRTARQEKKI